MSCLTSRSRRHCKVLYCLSTFCIVCTLSLCLVSCVRSVSRRGNLLSGSDLRRENSPAGAARPGLRLHGPTASSSATHAFNLAPYSSEAAPLGPYSCCFGIEIPRVWLFLFLLPQNHKSLDHCPFFCVRTGLLLSDDTIIRFLFGHWLDFMKYQGLIL